MQKKAKLLIVFNILFYIFICLHKSYSNDWVPQVLFYMALAFSTNVLEETFRNKINKLKVYSLIDFSLRIGVLIIHFLTPILNMNPSKINLITATFFIANILIEGIIVYRAKDMKEYEFEIIKQKDLNKFIDDFTLNQLDFYAMGTDLKNEIAHIMKLLKISGMSTSVISILFILVFISRFVYGHFIQFVFIPIVLIVFLLYFLFRLSYQLNNFVYSNNKHKKEKNLISIITFMIGYLILFGNEVIFYGKTGYFWVSINVIGILFFIPIYNTKYIVKMRLKNIYAKHKRCIE